MPIIDGKNEDYIEYFFLEDYINKIKLLSHTLEHLEITNKSFDHYMNELSKYNEEYIINYWIYLLYIEIMSNQEIECIRHDENILPEDKVFFDTLSISHKRIHNLHNFITNGELPPSNTYRNTEVNVSKYNPDGTETIFWRGAQAKDVNKFMSDFLTIYKQGGTSLIYSNPFLASSIIHLLFLRIHPYSDENEPLGQQKTYLQKYLQNKGFTDFGKSFF